MAVMPTKTINIIIILHRFNDAVTLERLFSLRTAKRVLRKEYKMKNLKSLIAALVMSAIMSAAPQANATTTLKVVIAGASAVWQSLALAAYNDGKCPAGSTAPCFHYTGSNFNLTDSRPVGLGGSSAVDTGNIWIVWDSATSTHIWAFVKVDAAVGVRCYFAQPRCSVSISSFPTPGNLISSALWGDNSPDSTPPSAVSSLFTSGTTLVSAAATDTRQEDDLFATCRSNSVLGGGTDSLAGLGYGANSSGVCPTFGASLADLKGGDILSGYPGSTLSTHVLAFNISGTDPFSNKPIPVASTVKIGAAPIVFITSRSGALAGVSDTTDAEAQSAFSGADCTGSNFVGGTSGNIQVYLREPLAGTMNVTEQTVFRRPNVDGVSQEAGVNATNPLAGLACTTGGGRNRAIGTSEVVKSVQNSNKNFTRDGIGYVFFSYGNLSTIASSSSYGYLTLNGVDGIFASYAGGDPGEPGNGTIPGAANLPSSCAGAFPCPESAIWKGGLSFPNLRNGTYRAWSVFRIISNGTPLASARVLVTAAQTFAVNSVPDFVPAVKIGTDPGLKFLRSHYGPGAVNSGSKEAGRDAGGCIEKSSSLTTQLVQEAPGVACSTFIE